MKNFGMVSAVLGTVVIATMASSASAQLNAWRINEVQTRTIGATNPAASRPQVIELHHPVANQSVTGLSLIIIRPKLLGTQEGWFYYREDLAGTATGNFFTISNAFYNSAAGTEGFFTPTNQTSSNAIFMRAGGATQGQFQEIHLVLTADIQAGYTPVLPAATAYSFLATDFSSQAQLIDGLYLCSEQSKGLAAESGMFVNTVPGTDPRIVEHPTSNGAAPPGAARYPDGSGAWYGLDIIGGVDGKLPVNASIGGSNPAALASVGEWAMY